ncbi:GNAT family N-acetyltransferase [Halobacillus litoralis]|uniref:GNAT family N-acetyltransferase n=1 Tax=Halobacillus litoralis TaxID=45668 RepID=UPI001CD67354|nr:GNAT family N-acetyltransferase [Halobacillus litoralis]MCA1021364.1 GNAT family N-acetyltransferase [Halobacillus litoralis]
MNQVLHVKTLTIGDLNSLKAMETGIEDDYVVRIFDRLVTSKSHRLFGLFQDDRMLSVAGYSLFGRKQFAMMGRLRSDQRFIGKGHATYLLTAVINDLKASSHVRWLGANTHIGNLPARRVLAKIGLEQGPVNHYLTLKRPDFLTGHTKGRVWTAVNTLREKRHLLNSLKTNALGTFPYECYYPFPYDDAFFTNDYLEDSSFYISPDHQRFVIIKNDTKKHDYSHVKYFWDDHYHQPGFFETLLHHWEQNPGNAGCWIDFSPRGFKNIPDLTPYDVQEPWILYGQWVKTSN